MTDRVRTLTVVLDRDYRDDDAESIVNAIQMVKGVGSVTTEVVDLAQHQARLSLSIAMRNRLYECVAAIFDGKEIAITEKVR